EGCVGGRGQGGGGGGGGAGGARRYGPHHEPTGKGKAVRRLKIFTIVAAAAGAALVAAVMTAGPARADTDPTTTTLTLASSRVVFGLESSFQMSIGVNASSGSWEITAASP